MTGPRRDDPGVLWRLDSGAVALYLLAGPDQAPAIAHVGPGAAAAPPPQALVGGARAASLIDASQMVALLPDPARGWTGLPGWADAESVEPWDWDGVEVDGDALTIRYQQAGGRRSGGRRPGGRRLQCTLRACGDGVFGLRFVVTEGAEGLNGARLAYTLPLPSRTAEALSFGGHWAGELQVERVPLAAGGYRGSHAGSRTAHDAFPGLVVGETGFGEDHGEVCAVHLGWFGNYDMLVARTREGRWVVHVLLAVDEQAVGDVGGVSLPELYLAWSDKGLNGIRCGFQDAARRMRRECGSAAPARVQLNTWEGVYFDHDPLRLQAMATAAAALGVERFVLDDGWFGRRSDDTRGLGDWTPRPDVYPDGLGALMDHVNRAGMEFGLWVEPEMVSADSALYGAHPEWILGRADQPLGRHQFGLDLCEPACLAHLQTVLAGLVADRRIASLKWDMNRDLPQAAGRPLVPAVLALLASVKALRPDLEVEACASGGGRADWSALAWCNRVWLSDAHDPDIRLPMMAAYGLFAPPEVMGSHIGPRTSHQTGRRWSLHARAAMAVLGSLGLELDPLTLGADERDIVRDYVSLHRKHRAWLHDGHLLVLPHPDPNLTAVGVFARSRDRALLCLLQRGPRKHTVPPPLRIRHLSGALTVRAPMRDRAIDIGAPGQPDWVLGQPQVMAADVLAGPGLALPILAPQRAVLVEVMPAAGAQASSVS